MLYNYTVRVYRVHTLGQLVIEACTNFDEVDELPRVAFPQGFISLGERLNEYHSLMPEVVSYHGEVYDPEQGRYIRMVVTIHREEYVEPKTTLHIRASRSYTLDDTDIVYQKNAKILLPKDNPNALYDAISEWLSVHASFWYSRPCIPAEVGSYTETVVEEDITYTLDWYTVTE